MNEGAPRHERPHAGFAVWVLVASLAGGLTGGVVASALQRPAEPAPVGAAPGGARLDAAGAARAVLPAVVTVLVGGSAGGSGTGVVIDKERGYIVTSSHVIQPPGSGRASDDVTILLADGRTIAATLLGNDVNTDVAVLKADGALPAQAVLSKDAVAVGSPVIAIGTPGSSALAIGALSSTVTSGVVSGTGRRIPREDLRSVTLTDLIQTDASIGAGMSGGPLVLVSTGQVIGLTTLSIRAAADLGFAISAATVRRIADEIIARGGGR